MSTLSVYTFAIAQADISANGDTVNAASWVNIPIIGEGTVEYTMQKAEVSDGEGRLQIIWRHTQRAKVTLRMKRFAYRVLEMISGSPVSSAQGTDQIRFGTTAEITPPFVRLRLQQRAVDSSNTAGYLEVIIYKAQGMLPSMTMREVTPGEYTVEFDALAATYNENGAVVEGSPYFRVKSLKSSLT